MCVLLLPVRKYPDSARTNVRLCSLKAASRHFARLHVALHVIGQLLTFDDFAQARAFDSRDVNKRIRAAVVGLNEAEAFCGIEPFDDAGGHDEPFQGKCFDRSAIARREGIATLKEEISSARGAKRATIIARQTNIDNR